MASILDTHFDDESDEEDFNPEQEVGSDNEEEANGRPSKPETSSKSRRRSSNQDDDDDLKQDDEDGDGEGEDEGHGDNDDDEDEEDEDDEDAVAGRPHKRRKRDPRMAFIDVEAEVDDEDEEEELDDEDVGDETHPDDLLDMPAGVENDDRRHRELDRQREMAAHLDAEQQAQALKERYGRKGPNASDLTVIPQRLLLPSVDDPSIWGVRVKPGKEREVVLAIMKKFQDRRHTREPLRIISAFERGSHTMAGYVYVEGRRQEDIMTACDGINFCYPRSKIQLIPIAEMPDLLRVTETKQLKPGAWVRIKRGTYAGDIAEVLEVETNGLEVTLKIIPRLSYGMNEDINGPASEKRKRPFGFGAPVGPRPPQRLFSEVEAKKKHSKFVVPSGGLRKTFTYLGEQYEDGFLIKNFKLQALETEVQPKLEEIQLFTTSSEDGGESLDLAALYSTIKAGAASSYIPGDNVEIYQGEQQGVQGKAVSVHKDIVQIRVTEGVLKGSIVEAPFKDLRKKFKDGDHVKVVGGSKYRDEVGMVVKVNEDRVTLLTDANNQEITVFSRDLREAADSGGAVGFTKYDLFDLVQLDAATVACVIKVDRESLRVLTQNGDVKTLLPSQISGKLEKRRHAAAIDRDGSEIRNDDTIKEYAGQQRQGRVMHIHHNFLFVQNRQVVENAGIFVVRSTNVVTIAAKGGRTQNAGTDFTKMNPNVQRNGGANGNQPQAMAPPKTMGRDRMIGKSVHIRKGPYKGLIGIVKDTNEKEARVELHSKNKTIAIPKENLAVTDPITGQVLDTNKFSRGPGGGNRGPGGGTPFGSSRTPSANAWDGGRTPSWQQAGSRTPAAGFNSGGRTPGWQQSIAVGNRTPAWNRGDGSRTVNPYADGSRTSYGGATSYGGSTWNPNSSDGGKTPAWSRPSDQGGRTPAYVTDQPTPGAWNAPKRTPAASGGYDAPTPGFSAPTPGGDMGGPTPGPYGGGYGAYGQTPAAAPTPGAYPETPGVYGAPTPGGYGDDDGPRYD